MNKQLNRITGMYLYALACMGENIPPQTVSEPKPYMGWEGKKCKSCKLFPCRESRNPQNNSCKNYIKRKK